MSHIHHQDGNEGILENLYNICEVRRTGERFQYYGGRIQTGYYSCPCACATHSEDVWVLNLHAILTSVRGQLHVSAALPSRKELVVLTE
jgi:hypothetical protein